MIFAFLDRNFALFKKNKIKQKIPLIFFLLKFLFCQLMMKKFFFISSAGCQLGRHLKLVQQLISKIEH